MCATACPGCGRRTTPTCSKACARPAGRDNRIRRLAADVLKVGFQNLGITERANREWRISTPSRPPAQVSSVKFYPLAIGQMFRCPHQNNYDFRYPLPITVIDKDGAAGAQAVRFPRSCRGHAVAASLSHGSSRQARVTG
jgi:hypothetical protein